jgi:hypothetical protein
MKSDHYNPITIIDKITDFITSTDKLNCIAEGEKRKSLYNYKSLWAEPEITEARKQQLANYKFDTPFSVEGQELKPGEGEKPKRKRPGVHAKSKTSKLKNSKNYKKLYIGQGN